MLAMKELYNGKTYQAREAGKVAVVVHHVMTLFVVVSLAFLIGVARREVSYPVEGSMSFDGVGDFVFWGSFESLGVGLSEGL
jgi:hypothetical protein